ncbi:MAG: hypothetical protein M1836_006188 [Candelina mexicana]|nr:MAG: hypothetical protein M1836_006188 [Candelina mexicana]
MEVEEPTMLEYARFHHLASDYRALHPLSSNGMPPPPENFLLGLADPDGATNHSHPSEICEVERLSFGKDEAMFLHSIIAEPEEPALVEWCSFDHRRHQKQKLELPLLRTDHELDVREFGQRIIPDFRRLNLPLEKVDEEDDEGLSWPKNTYRLPKELLSYEEKGKLQYSREAFLCLSTIIKDARTQDQNLYTLDTPPGHRKASASQSIGK